MRGGIFGNPELPELPAAYSLTSGQTAHYPPMFLAKAHHAVETKSVNLICRHFDNILPAESSPRPNYYLSFFALSSNSSVHYAFGVYHYFNVSASDYKKYIYCVIIKYIIYRPLPKQVSTSLQLLNSILDSISFHLTILCKFHTPVHYFEINRNFLLTSRAISHPSFAIFVSNDTLARK